MRGDSWCSGFVANYPVFSRGRQANPGIKFAALILALFAASIPPVSATVMDGMFVGVIKNGSDAGDFGGTLANPVSHDGETVTGSFTFDTANLPSNPCSSATVFCQSGPTSTPWETGTITLNGYTVNFSQSGPFGGVVEFAGQNTGYNFGDLFLFRQNPGTEVDLVFISNTDHFIPGLDPSQSFVASGPNSGDSTFTDSNASEVFALSYLSLTPEIVPEPGTLALFGVGLVAFAMTRRTRHANPKAATEALAVAQDLARIVGAIADDVGHPDEPIGPGRVMNGRRAAV